jgi:hypothetical protein
MNIPIHCLIFVQRAKCICSYMYFHARFLDDALVKLVANDWICSENIWLTSDISWIDNR